MNSCAFLSVIYTYLHTCKYVKKEKHMNDLDIFQIFGISLRGDETCVLMVFHAVLRQISKCCQVHSLLIPHICHRHYRRCLCKKKLPGVNFYRFNAKNWHFQQFLRKKLAFFTDLTRKIGVFRCKFYSPKILPV